MKTFLSLLSPSRLVVRAVLPVILLGLTTGAEAFSPAKANYNGLFFETNGATAARSGLIALTATSKGSYSASIRSGGKRYSLSGKFDAKGVTTATVKRAKLATLTLSATNYGEVIEGSIGEGNWSAWLWADQAATTATIRTNGALRAGAYTFFFQASTNAPVLTGHGFGTLKLTSSGGATLSASFPDGTTFTESAPVSESGWWPLNLPLAAGKGMALSWLRFSTNVLAGELVWDIPANTKAKALPQGVSASTFLAGSYYAPLPPGTSKAVYQEFYDFSLSDGGLSTAVINADTAAVVGNSASLSDGHKKLLHLSLSSANGLVTGKALDTTTSKWIPFKAAVIQGARCARGFFLNGTQSGRMESDWNWQVPQTGAYSQTASIVAAGASPLSGSQSSTIVVMATTGSGTTVVQAPTIPNQSIIETVITTTNGLH